MMTAHLAIALAAKHAGTNQSALLRLRDARSQEAKGQERFALLGAADSLKYSVGIFHADCKAVMEGYTRIVKGY